MRKGSKFKKPYLKVQELLSWRNQNRNHKLYRRERKQEHYTSATVGVGWGAGSLHRVVGKDSKSGARGRCAVGSGALPVEGAATAKALRQWCAWFCAQQQKRPWWLEQSGPEKRTAEKYLKRKPRSCVVLQVFYRILAFTLSNVRSH